MIKKIVLVFFLLSSLIFTKDIDRVVEENNNIKYRGIDVLNFYIPVVEKNRFATSIDSELRDDKDIYQWKIGEGYLEIDELWDFEYNIEREFYSIKDGEDYDGWDNKFTFIRQLNEKEVFNKKWTNDFITGLEHNQIDSIGFKDETYKIFAGVRTRTFFDKIGKGGTYFGFDLIAKTVFSEDKDGFSGEWDIVSATNLGYGLQFFAVLYNEYLSYNDYSGAYRLGIESYLRWTYELSKNWAFSVDLGLDNDKYFGNCNNDYKSEYYIYPHFLYSYNITSEFRFLGEIGLPSYQIIDEKGNQYENSIDHKYYYLKIGVEYIF